MAVAALALCAPVSAGTYVGGPITIADSASPPTAASPYPSTVTVSGEREIVTRVSVRVYGFTHQFPDEVDLLLVGPGGQTVLLISDAGAAAETNESFTVRDDATATLGPDSGLGGSFRPTDLDDGIADWFPAPAPPGPFGTSLSALAEPDANGTWSLYAVDDTADDAGSIGGWELTISSRDPWGIGAYTEQLSPPLGFPEEIGSVRVLIERGLNSTLQAGRVSYRTVPFKGNPTPGADYLPQSGRLEWGAGDGTTRVIDIPIIDDAVPEQQETLLLELFDPAGDVRLSRNPYSVMLSIAPSEWVAPAPPPLLVLVGGAKIQRPLTQRGVIVTAKSNLPAAITATGKITLPRHASALVHLQKVQRRVAAGQTVRVMLGLSKKTLRRVRRAFNTHSRLRATVRLTVKDTLGRTKSTVRKLTLRR